MPQPGNPQALNRYAYATNNPTKYRDPTGHWVETVWDVLNVGWDIAEVGRDPSFLNVAALVVDVAAVIIPAVPAGAGSIARGGKAAAKVASHADEALDAVRLAGHMGDGVHAVLSASKLAQAGTHADEAARLVKALAEGGTKGTLSKGAVVSLGHNQTVRGVAGYIDWAKATGATYLSVDPAAYDILDKAGKWWDVNRQFLDNAADVGAKFHLQLENAQWASGFRDEIDYLINKRGYVKQLINGEWWLVAP